VWLEGDPPTRARKSALPTRRSNGFYWFGMFWTEFVLNREVGGRPSNENERTGNWFYWFGIQRTELDLSVWLEGDPPTRTDLPTKTRTLVFTCWAYYE
jgi:hypothetical protein